MTLTWDFDHQVMPRIEELLHPSSRHPEQVPVRGKRSCGPVSVAAVDATIGAFTDAGATQAVSLGAPGPSGHH